MQGNLPVIAGGKRILPDQPEWPWQDVEIKESLDAAFESGDWGRYHGKFNENLVETLKSEFNVEHVRLCSSGTIATEIALRSIPVSEGDEVVLAGYDFPGNFRAIESTGARPVLIDLREGSWSLDFREFENAISDNTKAIIVSHLHGTFANISEILKVAKSKDLVVIEDICQCPFAEISGQRVGTFGDIATMSFGGSKLLSSGRGGAVLTGSDQFAQRATIFCERGNDAFPFTELQAAALLPQLLKLHERNETRLQNVKSLVKKIEILKPLKTLTIDSDSKPAFYKLPILVNSDELEKEVLISALQAEGINIDTGFRGFANRSSRRCQKIGDLQNAKIASKSTMLLHHPVLLESNETIEKLAESFTRVCNYLMNAKR